MSDFQKLTLKRYGRNFLIVCGIALLCYGGAKFELVRYAALAVLALIVLGGCAWCMISCIRWDWWLRGKLTEDEYKAYQFCERMFGWRDNNYLPTEEQIEWIAEHDDVSCDTLRNMFNKLHEEVQL